MKLLLCLDFVNTLARVGEHPLHMLMWCSMTGLIISGVHLSDTTCSLLSSSMVMMWGSLAGHPMRFLLLVSVMELRCPTLGKRAGAVAASACKRPASASNVPTPQEDVVWNPHENDTYLRRLLATEPAIGIAGLTAAILRDHHVTIQRNANDKPLRRWLETVKTTALNSEQLSEFYTTWVQEQHRADPILAPKTCFKRFLIYHWHEVYQALLSAFAADRDAIGCADGRPCA
jgi:hypothetical protein